MEEKGRNTINNFIQIDEENYETDKYFIWTMKHKGYIQITIADKNNEKIENWYDIWNIKNLIVGEDKTAIEIYPAKKDLIDGQTNISDVTQLYYIPRT